MMVRRRTLFSFDEPAPEPSTRDALLPVATSVSHAPNNGDESRDDDRIPNTGPLESSSSEVEDTAHDDDDDDGDSGVVVEDNENSQDDTNNDNDDQEQQFTVPPRWHMTTHSNGIHHMSLTELQQERQLARQRRSACMFLGIFVLFHLCVEALQQGDTFIIFLCLVANYWTTRLIQHNREYEEALVEQIRNRHHPSQNSTAGGTDNDNNTRRRTATSRNDNISQANAASRRYFRRIRNGGRSVALGVSEAAKKQWDYFCFHKPTSEHVGETTSLLRQGTGEERP